VSDDAATTQPRWDTPELGVSTVKSNLLYFTKHYGRERLEQAWRDAALPLPLSYVEDLANYVSVAFVERLLRVLVEASGDTEFLEKAARTVATPEAIGVIYYIMKGMRSPQLVYRKTIEISPNFNRVGEFTVEAITDTELTLGYRSKVRESDRSLCISRMTQFSSFPTIWGMPEAKVTELQCQVRGAD
jgi:hypothetical protein